MIRAELTKLRTVRGWTLGLAAAVVAFVGLGLLIASGTVMSCGDRACEPAPVGPEGQGVEDRFAFAHQRLDGDGSLTARVADLSGIITYPPPDHDRIVEGLVPWAKAGLIVKDGTRPGSAYASVLLTPAHGVRLQHNYVHDKAGPAGARWLRLTRSGDAVTGYASPDGTTWTAVGTAELPDLPRTVEIGFLVASPGDVTVKESSTAGHAVQSRFTQATAVFDRIDSSVSGAWRYDAVGADGTQSDWERFHRPAGLRVADGTLTLTGSGDVAPATGMVLGPVPAGSVPALLLFVVVAVLYVTTEFRSGLIRTTLLAAPRRGRLLAAKALVIGAVTFAAGLLAVAVARLVVVPVLRGNGNVLLPIGLATELRVEAGTAALLAVSAVLAYALGALLRRGLPAVLLAVTLIVVPYVVAVLSVLPAGAGEWLLRITPAAGFAIQQTLPAYAQVLLPYHPAEGYFPLPPVAGLAVTAGWALAVLALAGLRLRRSGA
ncbi:ABC transporter permease subunit [Actinoplanes sp. URMC 104]|uniref:ABC transporter permease subunit n=1 Tax=Actinoplanes sp. URMC 104 TaxID=3423409 RepID=UPI003F1A36A8